MIYVFQFDDMAAVDAAMAAMRRPERGHVATIRARELPDVVDSTPRGMSDLRSSTGKRFIALLAFEYNPAATPDAAGEVVFMHLVDRNYVNADW